jgi:hypothetical protein
MKLPALFLLFASAAGAAPSNTESHPSGCTIHVADPLGPVHLQAAPPLEALIELARSRHLCFAFENPGRDLLEPSVDLTLDNASPRSILDRFLQPARPYDITEDQGVISLRPKQKRHAPTLLDIVLPAFNAPPTETLEEASAALNVMLILLRKPKMISPGGGIGLWPNDETIGPIHEKNKTIRDILDLTVSRSNGASWMSGPCNGAELKTGKPCWVTAQYRHGGAGRRWRLWPKIAQKGLHETASVNVIDNVNN